MPVDNNYQAQIKDIHKYNSKPRIKKYHGPIINNNNNSNILKVKTDYHNKNNGQTITTINYVNKNTIPFTINQNDLPKNLRINGAGRGTN